MDLLGRKELRLARALLIERRLGRLRPRLAQASLLACRYSHGILDQVQWTESPWAAVEEPQRNSEPLAADPPVLWVVQDGVELAMRHGGAEGRTPSPQPDHCPNCESRVGAGLRFCRQCGESLADTDARSADTPARPADLASDGLATPPARRKFAIIAGAIALIATACAVGALIHVLEKQANRHRAAIAKYEKTVATRFQPMIEANLAVSAALERLRGTDRATAAAAVDEAIKTADALTTGIAALDVPEGSSTLASKARAAADRESSYLKAVRSVLDSPTSQRAGKATSLGAGLASSLSSLGPDVAGRRPSIQGTRQLAAWASKREAAIRRDAARRAARRERAAAVAALRSSFASRPQVDGLPSEYSGPFTSFDGLEVCHATDALAVCNATPSGKTVVMNARGAATYEGVRHDIEGDGPPLQMGSWFTTPNGNIRCESSTAGITCRQLKGGALFVIGDYSGHLTNSGATTYF